jgi:putative PIN family toxin of toxin-antitoxin system
VIVIMASLEKGDGQRQVEAQYHKIERGGRGCTTARATIQSVETSVVIDTNVFISALRSRRGASFRLPQLIGQGRFAVELSVALALEYESVGRRVLPETTVSEPAFEDILDFICRSARHREVYFSWRPCLPDPADDMVLELAVAAGGAAVVTFNKADFRGAERFGVRVVSPQEFLAELSECPT